MSVEVTKVGKRGMVVIPSQLRKEFGLEEGSLVIAEKTNDGVLFRPAVALPTEIYSKERQAELLLSNAVDPEDYRKAVEEVKKMGLEPEKIAHYKPKGS